MADSQALGGYELLDRLAVGGMAEIFLARPRHPAGPDQLVVVKRILPNLLADPQFVRMFVDETRALSALDHPNIVVAFDSGVEDGNPYLVMEYLRGTDLWRLLRRRSQNEEGPVPRSIALRVAIDAARALDYAHRATDADGRSLHIVHRDISPQNLFLTEEGLTKVLDFGIARSTGRSTERTQAGVLKGKILYMAPEQIDSEALGEAGPPADQFALGLVLYEQLVGRHPFRRSTRSASMQAAFAGVVEPPRRAAEGIPATLDDLLMRALQRRPEYRFPSCRDFADALEEVARTESLTIGTAAMGRWVRDELAVVEPESTPRASPGELPVRNENNGNLEIDRSPFFGRQRDLEAVRQAEAAGARLVTLVGPGGVGKTRLARRHAEMSLAEEAEQEVWCFEILETETAREAAERLATLLGVQVATHQSPLEVVGAELASRGPTRLLLDVSDEGREVAAQLLQAWLPQSASLQVLVSTRRALGLSDEVVLPVPPLSAAASHTLFTSAVPDPAAASPGVVEEICEVLAGIPLALEVAGREAARTSVDTVRTSLARVRSERGTPGLDEVLRWVWSLLPRNEALALVGLGVFHSDLDMETARQVVAAVGGEGVDVDRALASLEALGLLRAFPGTSRNAPWYVRTHDSVRDIARLAAGSDARPAGAALEAVVTRAEQLASTCQRDSSRQAFDRLSDLLEHLEAAWRLGVATGTPESRTLAARALMASIPALGWFQRLERAQRLLGRLEEVLTWSDVEQGLRYRLWLRALRWFRQLLDPSAVVRRLDETLLWARSAGNLELELLAHQAAVLALPTTPRAARTDDHLQAAVRLHDRGVLPDTRPITLRFSARSAMIAGLSATTVERAESALAAARAAGDWVEASESLLLLASAHLRMSNAETARPLLERALRTGQAVRHQALVTVAYMNLAVCYRELGMLRRGRAMAAESLRRATAEGRRGTAVHCSLNLAQMEWQLGEITGARERFEACGRMARTLGDVAAEVSAFSCLGALLADAGETTASARCFESIEEAVQRDPASRTAVELRRRHLHLADAEPADEAAARADALEALTRIGDRTTVEDDEAFDETRYAMLMLRRRLEQVQ